MTEKCTAIGVRCSWVIWSMDGMAPIAAKISIFLVRNVPKRLVKCIYEYKQAGNHNHIIMT